MCGWGATFGDAEIGNHLFSVDSSNVDFFVHFVNELPKLGFHWRDGIYTRRDGDCVVMSHIDSYNNTPQLKQWEIPVNEFASIMCAARGEEAGHTYERAKQFLDRNNAPSIADELDKLKEKADAWDKVSANYQANGGVTAFTINCIHNLIEKNPALCREAVK